MDSFRFCATGCCDIKLVCCPSSKSLSGLRSINNTHPCSPAPKLYLESTRLIKLNKPGFSVNIILLIFLAHTLFPRARPATSRFFRLSYYDAESGQYLQGPDDICLVAFWIVAFTGLRAGTMDYILKPIAQWYGLSKRNTTRFTEQAWLFIYDSIFWSLGMVRISCKLSSL
jgi:hypothetical protein